MDITLARAPGPLPFTKIAGRTRRLSYPLFSVLFLILAAIAKPAAAANAQPALGRPAEWQWSVPAPTIPDRRAFLWVPPGCTHVRGLFVAVQNMLEQPLFERAAFRAACAQNDLGIVLICSGHDSAPGDNKEPDHPKRSGLDIFLNPNYPKGDEDPKGAGEDLQKVLDALAVESGYSEIKYAPLMPVGHSSAGSFVWHLYRWDASRIFAMMPFKTGIKNDGPQGIPIFDIESEWFDYGNGGTRNVSSKPSDIANQLRARANGPDSLFGFYVDIGAGHCDVSDDSIKAVALFLKKVVPARIPENSPTDRPVALKPVATSSGWLLDPVNLGKPGNHPVAYADWKGAPLKGLWYLDRELAAAVQDHMAAQYAKKPQQLGFVANDGKTNTDGGTYSFSPKFLDDAGTFRVTSAFIDHLKKTDLFTENQVLDTTPQPIYYRVNSGALVQVGPDTFRVLPHAGPLVPQGNPWEPTLVAYTLGDATHRPTEHPAHVNVGIINTGGIPQTIDFPKIPDQKLGSLAPLKLTAKADSGLPVQFFMVSGPAVIEGGTLAFTPVPPRARFPLRVVVSAFQWGRSDAPRIQSAGPVTQEFLIVR